MILYNTLMGVCAGALLLTLSGIIAIRVQDGELTLVSRSTGFVLLTFGSILTVLAGAMTLTWPLNVNPPINIIFAEPNLLLGVVAVIAGVIFMLDRAHVFDDLPLVFLAQVVGLILTACTLAILRFDLVGDAPDLEPITGQLKGWENTFFAILYGLAALGALVSRWVLFSRWAFLTQRVAWLTAGVGFLVFSALNYYTHVGLLRNLACVEAGEVGCEVHRW